MREAFEKVQKTYEAVRGSINEKFKSFRQKFEGTKSEMAQEVMKAESPEDMIALGKKLQEQGEALKAENAGIEDEEVGEEGKYEAGKKEMLDKDHDEANEMNESFDENKAAEAAAAKEATEEAARAEEDLEIAKAKETEAAGLAEARAKLGSESVDTMQEQGIEEEIKQLEAEAGAVSGETQVLAEKFSRRVNPETLQDVINKYSEKYSEISHGLKNIEKSWEGVKNRALGLGIVSILAVDLPLVYDMMTHVNIADNGMKSFAIVASAVAVNAIGMFINKWIHDKKYSSLEKKMEKEVTAPRESDTKTFFANRDREEFENI